MTESVERLFKCYCDHCPNNTCTITNGLCYAEWKPRNLVTTQQTAASQAFTDQTAEKSLTTATSSLANEFNHQQSFTQQHPLGNNLIANNLPTFDLEKRYNCFNKDDPLIIRTIVCNETVSNTSHVIRRCCNSGDYCNRDLGLLPPEKDAKKLFETFYPHEPSSLIGNFYQQYSILPLGFKIIITLAALLLIIYTVTTIQNTSSTRRKRRRAAATSGNAGLTVSQADVDSRSSAIKRFLNRIISFGRSSGGPRTAPRNESPPHYDNHSLASREPLIKTIVSTNNPQRMISTQQMTDVTSSQITVSQPITISQQMTVSQQLEQQHPGPYMTDETLAGHAQNAYHMTMGSAAIDYQNDPSSGSGAGQPYLTQRSIAHDIELKDVVGRGYYGVVWRGEYKGEPVAVKIFSPMAEKSWEREAEIYQTTMLRHKNILGFVATDKRHDASLTGYWLVTDYYPMGSLYDFLKENTISMVDAVRMAFSIANGLAHLHVEIFGTRGKPSIAHRDMKSKNILVKNDGTCCIGDLGMGVRFNSHTGVVDVPTNARVGTRRYLSPEILDNKLNLMDFESVKAADVYAMGLVLWEILRRACLVQPLGEDKEMDPATVKMIERQATTAPTTTTSSNSNGGSPKLGGLDMNLDPKPAQSSRISPSPVQSEIQDESPQDSEQQGPATEGDQLKGDSGKPPEALSAISSETDTEEGGGPSLEQPTSVSITSGASETPIQRPPQSPPKQLPGFLDMPDLPSGQNQDSSQSSSSTDPAKLAVLTELYEVPFQHQVSLDPTAEEMRQAVCVKKLRPTMSIRWARFASMRDYANIMSECWYERPQARLSALRVRKSMGEIARKYFNLNMEYD